jgi:hypothetical protein
MQLKLSAAALAVSISIALSSAAFPRGEWPDGPNKAWFENLQRPDNHLYRVPLIRTRVPIGANRWT